MRIDAHQHFWRYDPARLNWISDEMGVLKRDYLPEDLGPELRAAGIDASIAVQAEQSEAETMFLLELARESPEIAGVVGWVDLRAESVRDRLEYFSQFEALAGFRHIAQSEPDDRFLVREDFLCGIAQLAEFDFTYDVLIYPKQLPAAAEMVARFPKQPFVIDHLAKPLIKSREIEEWARWMRQIAAHDNVFCKISGMVTEADWNEWDDSDFTPYLDVIFEAFGADRLIFGSDWPVCLVAASYARVKRIIAEYAADYAASDQAKIFGANAARFYGLQVAHGSGA